MSKMSLFGERSLTLVAATFSDRTTAVDAATALQADLPQTEVDLLRPHDANFARKMEPESQGIMRTAIRSHLVLGLAGLVLGAVVAHPTSPARSARAIASLRKAGGMVFRSL